MDDKEQIEQLRQEVKQLKQELDEIGDVVNLLRVLGIRNFSSENDILFYALLMDLSRTSIEAMQEMITDGCVNKIPMDELFNTFKQKYPQHDFCLTSLAEIMNRQHKLQIGVVNEYFEEILNCPKGKENPPRCTNFKWETPTTYSHVCITEDKKG